jgi:hypothetical protein
MKKFKYLNLGLLKSAIISIIFKGLGMITEDDIDKEIKRAMGLQERANKLVNDFNALVEANDQYEIALNKLSVRLNELRVKAAEFE